MLALVDSDFGELNLSAVLIFVVLRRGVDDGLLYREVCFKELSVQL